jgi:hypothetical protein
MYLAGASPATTFQAIPMAAALFYMGKKILQLKIRQCFSKISHMPVDLY